MEFTPEQIEFIIEKNLFTVRLLNAILGCDKGQHKKLLEDMAENKLTVSMIKSLATEKTEPTVAAKKEISSYPYGLKPINGVKIKNDKKKLAIEINNKDFVGIETDKIKENIRFLENETHAHIHLDLIVGLPGETLESFGKNLDEFATIV